MPRPFRPEPLPAPTVLSVLVSGRRRAQLVRVLDAFARVRGLSPLARELVASNQRAVVTAARCRGWRNGCAASRRRERENLAYARGTYRGYT